MADLEGVSVSSIYIWSKNFSHSSMQKSEAKHGGHTSQIDVL